LITDEIQFGNLEAFARSFEAFVRRTLPSLKWPSIPAQHRQTYTIFGNSPLEIAMIPVAKQWRAAKFDAGLGWLTGPLKYGGANLSMKFEQRAIEVELANGVPNEDLFLFGMEGVAPVVLKHGSEEIREQLLPRIFRGDWVVCQLYSEPDAGSDLASLSTRATRSGDGWLVSGQKVWSSNAHLSDVGVLLCRTGSAAERHRGITTFIVDMNSPGIEVRPIRQMDGSTRFNEVFLTNVRVPDGRRLGEVAEGWGVAMSVQANARGRMSLNRRRGQHGGMTAATTAERLAEMIRRVGSEGDMGLRQSWARVFINYWLLEPTAERVIAQASTPGAESAAHAMSKLGLANAYSAAAELIFSTLGLRITADTGSPDSFDWLPYVLQEPGYHIGGGTDQILRNVIAERGLGLPRA